MFEDVLMSFMHEPGVELVVIADESGLVVEHSGKTNVPKDTLDGFSAYSKVISDTLERVATDLLGERNVSTLQTILELDRHVVVMSKAPRSHMVILVLGSKDVNIGMLRLLLRDAVRKIDERV